MQSVLEKVLKEVARFWLFYKNLTFCNWRLVTKAMKYKADLNFEYQICTYVCVARHTLVYIMYS